jgi:hypothetical protein
MVKPISTNAPLARQAFYHEMVNSQRSATICRCTNLLVSASGKKLGCVKLEIIMDELINLVVQKTGISQDDARKAVEVIINCLKSKLPGPIASHLDSFVSGGLSGGMSTLAGEAGEMLKGKLGGIFEGGKT